MRLFGLGLIAFGARHVAEMPVRAQHEPPHLLYRGLVSEMRGLVAAT